MQQGYPHPRLEFNWPIGKEIPADIRRLNIHEFYLAVQLAAKCINHIKGDSVDLAELSDRFTTSLADLRIEHLSEFDHLRDHVTNERVKIVEELQGITRRLDALKSRLEAQQQPQPEPQQPQPQPQEPQQQPQEPQQEQQPQPKRGRGRPRKSSASVC